MPQVIHHYYHDDAICHYEYDYPGDVELLDIFPEASAIIPESLRELRAAKRRLVSIETRPYFKACNSLSDPFSRAFWKECYLHMAGGFRELVGRIERLERLQAILKDPVAYRDRKVRISRARAIRMSDLYAFRGMRRVRGGFTALCPLHGDRDASFRVYERDNSWHCFGCGAGGDGIRFIRLLHGLGFTQAVSYILGGSR